MFKFYNIPIMLTDPVYLRTQADIVFVKTESGEENLDRLVSLFNKELLDMIKVHFNHLFRMNIRTVFDLTGLGQTITKEGSLVVSNNI